MSWLNGFHHILTTLAGIVVATGAALEAGGVSGGAEVAAAATAFGLVLAKDGNKE